MNPIAIAILLGGMIVFMLLGIPLAFSIFGISTVVLTLFTRLPPWQLIQRFLGGVDSFVLTAIPFWLVMAKVIPSSTWTAVVILGFAAVQIVVHMVYFLHLDAKSEGGWNMLSTIFTLVIVVIMLAGSLWVMHHLNTNMMPMSSHEARNLP